MTYNKLYEQVSKKAGKIGRDGKPILSKRMFASIIKSMIEEKRVIRVDRTKQRGFSVSYSVSKKTMMEHQLRLLGIDKNKEKLRGLYQYLIFFECFKEMDNVSKSMLDELLAYNKATIESLVPQSSLSFQGTNIRTIYYAPVGELNILQTEFQKAHGTIIKYRVKQRGFTEAEIKQYMKGPDKLLPFVADLKYSDKEIENGIANLKDADLIELSPSYNKLRFKIKDSVLQAIVDELWKIHELQMSYILHLWNYREYSSDEKSRLEILLGKNQSEKLLRETRSGRLLRKEEKPEDSLYRKQISTMIEMLLKKFSKDYGSKIIENPLIEDTIQKLLLKQSFLHFVMKSTN